MPHDVTPRERLPVVVLLHGFGQGKPTGDASRQQRAIHAWEAEYGITLADERLRQPPLERLYPRVLYLTDPRIAEINRALTTQPFRRVVLVCPITPIPYFQQRTAPLFIEFANWVGDELLPTVRRLAPASGRRAHTGIAGHSMGGQIALEVLLRRPDLFAACMPIQAAIEKRQAYYYAKRFEAAFPERRPALHIMTSNRDLYVEANRRLRAELEGRGVAPAFTEPFGHHATSFVREIGSLELLLWMSETLRTTVAPEQRFGGFPPGYPLSWTP
ncbi:MAG: alpha/beta hydrolase-fold protein [Polyangiaceae bacterium]